MSLDETDVDAWLQARGVPHGIGHLIGRPALCREHFAALLDLLRQRFSLGTGAAVAEALFGCGPTAEERREIMGVVLEILKAHAGEESKGAGLRLINMVSGATLVDGLLIDNVDATHVHVVGELTLDKRHGANRAQFTYALRKIRNAEAISYLERATKDPEIAFYALTALVSLGEDEKAAALAEEAIKLAEVHDKAGIGRLLSSARGKYLYEKERRDVNARLKAKGVVHELHVLYEDPALSPNCAADLVEIYESTMSFQMRAVLADALFMRNPNASQKRRAVEAMLKVVRENMGRYDIFLSTMVLNQLAQNITAEKVHEIGEMTFDERYGELRAAFAHVLYRIGNAEAITYLMRAAKEPVTASLALDGLARLRVEGTYELCEEALKNPRVVHKEAINYILKKLKRKLAKKAATVSHVTDEPVPEGLEEWSANLDGEDLPKVLRAIQKCVEGGFGKAEIAEVLGAAVDLAPEGLSNGEPEEVCLKFAVQFGGGNQTLWLEVFCDDEDAFDLYVFGPPKLIKELDEMQAPGDK